MWKWLLDWLRKVVDKRICTVDEFESACKYAMEVASKDQDGFISVKEAVKIIISCIWNKRK